MVDRVERDLQPDASNIEMSMKLLPTHADCSRSMPYRARTAPSPGACWRARPAAPLHRSVCQSCRRRTRSRSSRRNRSVLRSSRHDVQAAADYHGLDAMPLQLVTVLLDAFHDRQRFQYAPRCPNRQRWGFFPSHSAMSRRMNSMSSISPLTKALMDSSLLTPKWSCTQVHEIRSRPGRRPCRMRPIQSHGARSA